MTKSKDSIVMGPEGLDTPGDMLDAPMLTTKTDKFEYRRNVRMWYECVQSSAESGYTKAKDTAGNLGHALFTRMEPRYKRVITSAIDSGTIRLRTHQDGRRFSGPDHIKCVEKMLDLVAKESATDRVKRLIRMTKEVHECKRSKNETFQEFSDRYEGLARAYLGLAKVRPDSQDEQNFAVMAIDNANLPISTYNTVINNLVSHAKENVREHMTVIPTKLLQEIIQGIRNQHALIDGLKAAESDNQRDNDHIKDIKMESNGLVNKSYQVDIPKEDETPNNGGVKYVISLAKALEELQDIRTEDQRKAETKTSIGHDPEKDGTADVTKNVTKQIGTMMGSRYDSRDRGGNHYGRKHRRDRSSNWKGAQRRIAKKQKHRGYSSNKRYDTETEEDDTSDEETDYRGKKRNVLDRLGSRRRDDSAKRVRFKKPDKSPQGTKPPSPPPVDEDSDTDAHFRIPDRRSS